MSFWLYSYEPSRLPLISTGGITPRSSRFWAAWVTIMLRINRVATLEPAPTGCASPSRCSKQSPLGQRLSITTSQYSYIFLPLEWREVVPLEWASEVTPITGTLRWRASMAISMGAALRPELEITMRESLGV